MKIYDFDQRSEEWYNIRKLKFTASDASTIMAMGKGLDTLIEKMLVEYYSSGQYEEYSNKYLNKNIQRGIDFENKARLVYEFENDTTVEQVGFVELDSYTGASPDGLVGKNGLIEIKNHNDEVFLKLFETRKIEKKYIDQMQFQMYVTGRNWCDYIGFNPNFTPNTVKIRVNKDYETQAKITEALRYAIPKLKERKEKLDRLFKNANGKTTKNI